MLALVCLPLLFGIRHVSARQEWPAAESPHEVRSLMQRGRYAAAEQAAESLLSRLGKSTPVPELDHAQASDLLVEALLLNGKGADPRTRSLAERALDLKTASIGAGHLSVADSLRNLGDVLVALGDYQLGAAEYQRALTIREKAGQASVLELAEDLDRVARLQTLTGELEQAASANSRSLSIKGTLESTDIRLAPTLEVGGVLLQRKSDYAGARSLFERALAIREAADPAHPGAALSLNLLGQLLWQEGDLVRAKAVSSRAVSLAEAVLRPGHPDIALCLTGMALSVSDLGDLVEARALRERALTIAEQAFGADHPAVALQQIDLANSLLSMGEFTAARSLYERAFRA